MNILTTRPKRTIAGIWIFAVLIASTACMGSSEPTYKDVTADKKYWGGYKPDSEYVLQQDLFIMSVNGGQAQLYAPEQNTGSESATREKYTVPSLQEYRDAPGKRAYIIGLLPKGSRIRVVKFELYSFSEDTQLKIHAQPTEGQFKGKDMEIRSLSLASGEGLALSPNPEDLKEAENAATTTSPATAPAK